MIAGHFHMHITGSAEQADELAAFADEHGVKFTHIELGRGAVPSQPMLTPDATGGVAEARAVAESWRGRMERAGLRVMRVKIEAAPDATGLPESDEQADRDLYWEHHVRVLEPAKGLWWLIRAAKGHQAHVSRNPRRTRPDGVREWFVTQRFPGAGRATAEGRLAALLAALRETGASVVEVEQEYVVHDDALHLDRGWLELAVDRPGRPDPAEDEARTAPAGTPDYPSTYRPLAGHSGRPVQQWATFDPALKHFAHAYTAADPVFDDPADQARWQAARRAAAAHVLACVTRSGWAGHLVLRGSTVLQAWLGEAAREPGDLDFVVVPASLSIGSAEAPALLAGLVAAVADEPGAGLRADRAVSEYIWTYERVPGRRIVIPFEVDGLPQGVVQLDVVFEEDMPEEPVLATIPPLPTPVRVASPALSLMWKLQWLMTDLYPQGKDLYDAVLLAEYTTVELSRIRDVLRPELGGEADQFVPRSVLGLRVDWDNFRDEVPGVEGDAEVWLLRLAEALGRCTTSAGEPG